MSNPPTAFRHEYLIRNKRVEWDSFKAYVTPFELQRYFPIL